MPFPHYKQLDSMDCGPTCLRIIAKYYGKSYSLPFLREKCYIDREGVSLKGISEAAELIGFRTLAVKLPLMDDKADSSLLKAPLPAIAHWNQNHFVVIYKISKKYFNLQGEPIDLNSLQQNDRVIVQINATPEDYQTHPTMIVDMLPAGFEIETLLTTEDAGKQGVYSWLGDLTEAQVAEARDDRYVAAIDLTVSTYNNYYRGSAGTANLAYVARVVTPGEFSLPGVFVEDMYRPGVTSHTDVSRITIEPAQ